MAVEWLDDEELDPVEAFVLARGHHRADDPGELHSSSST
jgi:hypothetical protein